MYWVWYHTPVIPTLGRVRQEECRFKTNKSYIVSSCLKKKEKEKERNPTANWTHCSESKNSKAGAVL
jgi:hypothetical protein